MSAQIEPLLTVADLDLMPDDGNRYELIEGELVVSHAPGLSHQELLDNLMWHLKSYLSGKTIGKAWSTPGVIFDDRNAVIPDIVFVATERLGEIAFSEKVTGNPDLAVEILSPGSENSRRDRTVKLHTYSKFGVSEYWIVDGYQRTIEIYRLLSGGLQLDEILREQAHLTTPLIPGFSCTLEQVFAG